MSHFDSQSDEVTQFPFTVSPNLIFDAGHVLCESASSGEKDVNQAVASAKEAFKVWSETPALERARILQKAALMLRVS